MSTVFADTFYFLGLTNPDDRAHSECLRFSGEFRGAVVTTTAVLIELADALATPPFRRRAVEFIGELPSDPQTRIVKLTPELFQRGFEFYARHADKKWSLTDCISFVVMRDEGITDALTGNHDFEQAGFKILLK
jgi:predicted nucleic acid-binding protein